MLPLSFENYPALKFISQARQMLSFFGGWKLDQALPTQMKTQAGILGSSQTSRKKEGRGK